ncbi:hypothetical protein DPMN_174117 [Dreissena polymorpha]|uniref:Uncharacterized protein n=1 Tax=Dreissena polymorpha TaxID=45954 RepID=A0A9D4E424_DREPO|nr:hypothetical protein DPMN_174117 [Dreissena polymorpha]
MLIWPCIVLLKREQGDGGSADRGSGLGCFGLYGQLMVELRREDPRAFINIIRMPPEMFDGILARYADGVMPLPTTATDWTQIADGFRDSRNFPHTPDPADIGGLVERVRPEGSS